MTAKVAKTEVRDLLNGHYEALEVPTCVERRCTSRPALQMRAAFDEKKNTTLAARNDVQRNTQSPGLHGHSTAYTKIRSKQKR